MSATERRGSQIIVNSFCLCLKVGGNGTSQPVKFWHQKLNRAFPDSGSDCENNGKGAGVVADSEQKVIRGGQKSRAI